MLFISKLTVFAEDESDAAGSMKVLVETFLNNLSNCVNRELIDKVWTIHLYVWAGRQSCSVA